MKQEAPSTATNGASEVKNEHVNGTLGTADRIPAGLQPEQQGMKQAEEAAQNVGIKAEPEGKEDASLQIGASAVKPEEAEKQVGEGHAHGGHDSDEESDLEDEEEEHDEQVCHLHARYILCIPH